MTRGMHQARPNEPGPETPGYQSPSRTIETM